MSDNLTKSVAQPNPATVPTPRATTRNIVRVVVVLVCLLAVAIVHGAILRVRTGRELARTVKASAEPPPVDVIHPAPATQSSLSIPGTTQAISDAVIYARTSGYITKRYVDIGDNVKSGQLLAEIESPEIDRQLVQ